jgi:hypothetical protein
MKEVLCLVHATSSCNKSEYCWRSLISGMWRNVFSQIGTSVLEELVVSMFIQNFSTYLPRYKLSYPTRLQPSHSPPWKPQTSRKTSIKKKDLLLLLCSTIAFLKCYTSELSAASISCYSTFQIHNLYSFLSLFQHIIATFLHSADNTREFLCTSVP